MKNFLLFRSLLIVVVLTAFMYSCAPKYGAYFQNSPERSPAYTPDEHAAGLLTASTKEEAVAPEEYIQKADEALVESVSSEELASSDKINDEIAAKSGQLVMVPQKDKNGHMTEREEMILDALKVRMKEMTKKEKKEFKSEVLKYAKAENLQKLSTADNLLAPYDSENPDTNTLLLVILAVLLPPLAVGLHEGELNGTFWLNLVLTLLFYVPGLIHALIVILR